MSVGKSNFSPPPGLSGPSTPPGLGPSTPDSGKSATGVKTARVSKEAFAAFKRTNKPPSPSTKLTRTGTDKKPTYILSKTNKKEAFAAFKRTNNPPSPSTKLTRTGTDKKPTYILSKTNKIAQKNLPPPPTLPNSPPTPLLPASLQTLPKAAKDASGAKADKGASGALPGDGENSSIGGAPMEGVLAETKGVDSKKTESNSRPEPKLKTLATEIKNLKKSENPKTPAKEVLGAMRQGLVDPDVDIKVLNKMSKTLSKNKGFNKELNDEPELKTKFEKLNNTLSSMGKLQKKDKNKLKQERTTIESYDGMAKNKVNDIKLMMCVEKNMNKLIATNNKAVTKNIDKCFILERNENSLSSVEANYEVFLDDPLEGAGPIMDIARKSLVNVAENMGKVMSKIRDDAIEENKFSGGKPENLSLCEAVATIKLAIEPEPGKDTVKPTEDEINIAFEQINLLINPPPKKE